MTEDWAREATVQQAPIVRMRLDRSMAQSSLIRARDTTCSGATAPLLMFTMRSVPPAIGLTPPPSSAIMRKASARVAGSWYWNRGKSMGENLLTGVLECWSTGVVVARIQKTGD